VIPKAGEKVTPRMVKKWIDDGKVTELLVPFEHILGRFVARDIINEETGAIWVEAGDELTWRGGPRRRAEGRHAEGAAGPGVTEVPVLDIDGINVGPTSATPWRRQGDMNREQALLDIYRVMRPGEPPTARRRRARCSSSCSSIPSATTSRPSAG
jgi:DNA-directed RNA polymerase subunit beta